MDFRLKETIHETHRLIKKTEHSFCVINHEPLQEGHVMVLPIKEHYDIGELSPEEAADFLGLVQEVYHALKKAYGKNPFILMNTFDHRSEDHLHVHIIPTDVPARKMYGAAHDLPPRKKASDEELQKMRDAIQPHLG